MAMAFSLAACADVPVTVNDRGCMRKTFSNYFDINENPNSISRNNHKIPQEAHAICLIN
ncbi:hypothetical protein RND71_028478 [Anisodus tanguticus]|uniref:Uncharacterized protein n=1 Tax=Anisodus tanguticus TaxID=243964 RepID=A0AAE1VA31_9SOLA|nr:hypothetical protein RND71_028478 [Anisodus tanguticus]